MQAFERTQKQIELTKTLTQFKNTLAFGGSGSGKTFAILRALIIRACKVKSRHLIVRAKLAHAVASIWHENLPDVFNKCFPYLKYVKKIKDGYVILPNKSEIWLAGIDDKIRTEKILGRSLSTIYINECSQVTTEGYLMLRTRLREKNELKLKFWGDCNPPGKRHWTYKYFVEKKTCDNVSLGNPEDFGYIQLNPGDNQRNLPADYLSDLKSLPDSFKKRFWYGNFSDELEGALFQQKWIDDNKCDICFYHDLIDKIDIDKTVLGIDPAITDNDDSDLTGLIVAASGTYKNSSDEYFFVIDDQSLKGSPGDWAKKAIYLAKKYDVDEIIIETNQGGDMCVDNLKNYGYTGKIERIHAKQNKKIRAEPVAGLYEKNIVKHLNHSNLYELESEMTNYVPFLTKKSPDRLDALVYAISALSGESDHLKFYKQLGRLADHQ